MSAMIYISVVKPVDIHFVCNACGEPVRTVGGQIIDHKDCMKHEIEELGECLSASIVTKGCLQL